jgi:hypothetical protein
MLYIYQNGDRYPLGAATWISGRGLLTAELGAQHQGQVHLVQGADVVPDGLSLDIVTARGDILATVIPMEREEFARYGVAPWQELVTSSGPQGEAWRAFWAAEIASAKGED